jgi:hypothetical protein
MLSHENRIKYSLFYSLLIVLLLVVGITWGLSFIVPLDEPKPIKWMMTERPTFFASWVFFLIALLGLYIAVVYDSRNDIGSMEESLEIPGVFFVATTILLLSSFFIYQDKVTEYKRFYDTHPLIVYTSAVLLAMGIVVSVVNHVQVHISQHIEI